MKKSNVLFVLFGCALLMWAAVGQAPETPPASPAPPAPTTAPAPPSISKAAPQEEPETNTRDLAELVMAVKLTKDLGLDDEQTVLMVRKLSDFRDQTNALRKERQQAAKELRAAIQAKVPDAQIEAKLNALAAMDDKITSFRKDRFAKLSEGLNPNKKAILYVFVNEFENEMKQLIQKVKERREQLMGDVKNRQVPPQPALDNAVRERVLDRMQERNEKNASNPLREHRRENKPLLPPEREK